MNKLFLVGVCVVCAVVFGFAQPRELKLRTDVPLDSIRLSDPFILADSQTNMYYMTGTGGLLWKRADLETWTCPFRIIQHDPTSWLGPPPMVWAGELPAYKGDRQSAV